MSLTDGEIEQSLIELLDIIEKHREAFQDHFERFRVALSGGLRLLTGKDGTMLSGLQGNPEDVAGYLIRTSEETFTSALEGINQVRNMIMSILESVRKQ